MLPATRLPTRCFLSVTDSATDVTPANPHATARRSGTSATLAEVAQLAGVSPMTVSRAFHSPNLLSLRTLARVRSVIQQTGFVPNRLASSLATRQSRLVAAITPTFRDPVHQEMLAALAGSLAESGYQLVVGQGGDRGPLDDTLLNAVIGRRPDSIVLCDVAPSPLGRMRLEASRLAVVEAWALAPDPIDITIGFSLEAVARGVVDHLCQRRRRHLAYVSHEGARARPAGEAFVIHALGNTVAGERAMTAKMDVYEGAATLGAGRSALRRILARQPDADAVFLSSDVLALGASMEAMALGIRVPEQLEIMGFGDGNLARDACPALSSVRIDAPAIGHLVARSIVEGPNALAQGTMRLDVGFSIMAREGLQESGTHG